MKRILLILMLCMAMLLPGCSAEPQETVPPRDADWTINYNQRSPTNSNCVFYGERETKDLKLTRRQLRGIVPKDAPTWMEASGYRQLLWVKFSGDWHKSEILNKVDLTLTTSLPETTINLDITHEPGFNDDAGAKTDLVSTCNGVDYWVYEIEGSKMVLYAKAWIGDYWYSFSMAVEKDMLEPAKADFKAV